MKHFLIIITLVWSNLSIGQVATLMYVEVSNDNQSRFERLEKDYWSQIAKKGIEEGKMIAWGMLKEVSVPGVHRYVFVNLYKDLNQLTNGSSIWNPEVIGMNFEDIDTNAIKTILKVDYHQLEGEIVGDMKYVIHNHASPNDLEGFVTENLELWKPWFEDNMKKNRTTQKNWGIATKIYPSGDQAGSTAMTRDGFENLADAMNALRYQPENNSTYAAILAKSKMSDYLPNGFDKRVIYESLMWVN